MNIKKAINIPFLINAPIISYFLKINLTAYLSEKGRTVQEVETAIKPLISYTPPNSLLLGLHGNRKNVEWELRKRVDLVSRILSELKQV